MIRLLIIVLIRWFIAALVIYGALTLLKKIIRSFLNHSRPSPRAYPQEHPPKDREEYKDVQDAKFVEMPNKPVEDKQKS